MPVRHEIMGAVATALVVLALASRAIATGVASPRQRLAADALVRTAGEFPPPTLTGVPDVAIVRIDPQSLRAFPEWPWPRQLYAAAVDRLTEAGAAAIAFDVDFSTPREAEGDAAFADAIGRSGRVVLAAFRQVQELPGGAELEVANLPPPALADRAAAIGSVLMPVDSDGVVRRGTRASRIGGTLRAPLPAPRSPWLPAATSYPPRRGAPRRRALRRGASRWTTGGARLRFRRSRSST